MTSDASRPPDFAHARSRRQRQLATGLHPDYWYPVLFEKDLKVGEVKEVVFWKESIAVFRGTDGKVRALENRCAHRQLKLSKGQVRDCRLTCAYHGWTYDDSGKCVEISHSLFGKKMPNFRIGSFPVQVRYGLIWVFPGNPAMATVHTVPEIPEWSDKSWPHLSVAFHWKAHHSMVIDNSCDFTHAYLHRNRPPFSHSELTHLQVDDPHDAVNLSYDTQVAHSKLQRAFVNRANADTNSMQLGYKYPYQWSNTDDKIRHWMFVLPIDERSTTAFFLFYFAPQVMQVPGIPIRVPGPIARGLVMPFAKRFIFKPLLEEDGVAVEAEQEGYDAHFEQPTPDLNPVLHAFQSLTIRKWEQHLAETAEGGKSKKAEVGAASSGTEVSPPADVSLA